MPSESVKMTFTLSEAAELLNCHKATLRKAISGGALRAARLGRDYRISRLDLQSFWIKKGGGALFEESEKAAEDLRKARPAVEKPEEASGSLEKGPRQLTLF
ncbi:MAG: excisionase family DNA-binding protein [Desulfovibrionaceae bacterium]|nr:excisionase family DNA-binding protein [Desulfovibrionaceae bacterium]